MLAQSYPVDEVEVGVEDLLGCVPADDADEQRDDALHDECVAVGGEEELAASLVALQPHAALAAVDEVLLGFVFLVELVELVA